MLECLSVGFVIRLGAVAPEWLGRGKPDFYTAKNHVSVLASFAGVELGKLAVSRIDSADTGWQAGHAAVLGELTANFEAKCGLLSLEFTRSLGIEGPVLAGIIHVLPASLAGGRERSRYRPFSLLPAALRDLAVVVDGAAEAESVRRGIQKAARSATGGKFQVDEVRLFDVYQGKGLPEGKKSLAFSLAYRASDRTLTDDEVSAAFTALQSELEKTGHHIRK